MSSLFSLGNAISSDWPQVEAVVSANRSTRTKAQMTSKLVDWPFPSPKGGGSLIQDRVCPLKLQNSSYKLRALTDLLAGAEGVERIPEADARVDVTARA